MIARLYDALHDPATHDVLTCATHTGSGGYTHTYFRAPSSVEDLVGARDAIAAWARIQCMAEYGLDGWTVPDLINPRDVNHWRAIFNSQTAST
jgi:hypothetical protein